MAQRRNPEVEKAIKEGNYCKLVSIFHPNIYPRGVPPKMRAQCLENAIRLKEGWQILMIACFTRDLALIKEHYPAWLKEQEDTIKTASETMATFCTVQAETMEKLIGNVLIDAFLAGKIKPVNQKQAA